jgi:hypothetical protein
MKPLAKILLQMGLSYGIMRREEFEEMLTKALTDKFQHPKAISDLNHLLFSQLEELKDYLLLDTLVENAHKKETDDLKAEIKDLKETLNSLSEKIDLLSKK